MSIFGRKRRTSATGVDTDPEDSEAPEDSGDSADSEESGDSADEITVADTEAAGQPSELDEPDAVETEADEPAFDRARGPFDRAEVEQDGSWLDLGALWVPAVDGMQVQLEMDQATQVVSSVQLALDGSVVQLQAFAAPRTGALWPEIRTEIALSITAQGGSVQVVDGPLGPELAAKLPKQGPDVRFVGVDGPRWFLRAVISGPAATDDAAGAGLVEAVRGTVVVRGSEAMAPRELLPLRVPITPEPDAGAAPQSAGDELKPFERGPEITEVR
ncbi:MAG: DUF3710 domain-containing protein [Dermatophilaceae bacterium]